MLPRTRSSLVGDVVQPAFAGVLASVVGFAGAVSIVLAGYQAVGATTAEAASALMVLTILQGLTGIGLSWWSRQPVSIAWSTPGAALLMTTGTVPGGFPTVAGACILAAGLIVLAGLWRPFGRAVSSIPTPLASAMLAGILLEICLQPAIAASASPGKVLPVIAVWLLCRRFATLWATPMALVAAAVLVLPEAAIPAGTFAHALAPPLPFMPRFDAGTTISLGLPLFLVAMASQNVPGLAVMRANGYEPPVRPIFLTTGVASGIIAAFGGHQINLAAITAALCAGPEAHADRDRRWVAAASSGVAYVALGLSAGGVVALFAAVPPLVLQTVAGLALLGSFGSALAGALAFGADLLPALVTFIVAASGVSGAGVHFLGIGPAFWSLMAGGAALLLGRIGTHGAGEAGRTRDGVGSERAVAPAAAS